MISHNWSPMKRLIWLRGSGITGGSATWSTISGNPVSFTAKAAPLRQLKVAFSPVQSGTGDPSPTNVRPISGWSSLTVYHSGADTSNPQTISISLGETVYSGYVDVISGVGEVTGGEFTDAGTASWNMAADFYIGEEYSRIYTNTGFRKNAQSWSMMNWLKKIYAAENANGYWYDGYTLTHIRLANSLTGIVYGEDTRQTAIAKFKAYFAEHPIQFVYELATPIPIQLTPQEVQSLAGDNVLFSDANGDLTVEYRSN